MHPFVIRLSHKCCLYLCNDRDAPSKGAQIKMRFDKGEENSKNGHRSGHKKGSYWPTCQHGAWWGKLHMCGPKKGVTPGHNKIVSCTYVGEVM